MLEWIHVYLFRGTKERWYTDAALNGGKSFSIRCEDGKYKLVTCLNWGYKIITKYEPFNTLEEAKLFCESI
jgi:hypothetical protein